MKTRTGLKDLGRLVAAAALTGAIAGPSLAQGGAGAAPERPTLPPPAVPPGQANRAANGPASQPAAGSGSRSAVPGNTQKPSGLDWPSLLLAAGVAAAVSGGVAFVVVTRLRPKKGDPAAASPESSGPTWPEFEAFRGDVLDLLNEVRAKAGSLDSVPEAKVQDWTRRLARARADLERAPLTRADYEPLRKLWVEVTRIGQDMSDRAKRSSRGEELAGSLFTFTQALSRRSQDAAQADGVAATAHSGADRAELQRLEMQWERESRQAADQLKELTARLQRLEERPAPTLGALVEEEFRALCDGRAAELERALAGVKGRTGSSQPVPPVVPAAMSVAEAALRVSEEAIRARGLDPAVKAQLTNLATLASTLQAMCPVALDPGRPPGVEGIRRLPERPEARWQPEMVARGGSVINAVTAYWSEVNRLLQAETAPLEQYLAGSAPDAGARDAAIGDWLAARLLPLLDQAAAAFKEDGPPRREAREGGSTGLVAALDELHRACDRVVQGTGLEHRLARKGETLRPQPGVKVDYADNGQSADSVLEVRQVGWCWNGRLLRELHVVVQEERASSGPSGTNGGADPGPSQPDEGSSRVKRL